jgi:aryl-alcohol dehydrogenase-like predicted oxidoreductase
LTLPHHSRLVEPHPLDITLRGFSEQSRIFPTKLRCTFIAYTSAGVDEVKAVAVEAHATPAQIALAWLLAQGDDIAPIPGTKRVARVEENTAADRIELSAEQIERLNNLTPAAGERHEEGVMATIDR